MNLFYDHTNNSIQIGHTLSEYIKAVGEKNGTQYWVSIDDDIDLRIKYRHEHAHFSSFNSTGLIELQAAYQDYKLFLYTNFILKKISDCNGVINIPIIEDKNSKENDALESIFLACLKQITQQEAFFFGWGTNISTAQLFDFTIQDEFCEKFDIPYWHPSATRLRKLTKQLLYTSPIQVQNDPDTLMPKAQTITGEIVNITSRAILESYAITIEVFAEYIKTMVTNFTKHRTEPKRIPNKNNLLPIELILRVLTKEKIEISDYVHCKIPIGLYRVYHCVSLITTVAMQIPVVEDYLSESIFMGSIKQLCPAHRFAHILQNIESGKIPNPFEIKNYYDKNLIIDWINTCQQSIGDPWSLKFYQHINAIVASNFDAYSLEEQKYSMHKTSWLGRHHFYNDPCDFLSEAGILHSYAGFQIRWVKTSDGVVIGSGYKDVQEQLFGYLVDSVLHIFDAICIGDHWEDSWKRLGFISLNDETKKEYLIAPLSFYLNKQFRDMAKTLAFIPKLEIRKGFSS